MDQPHAPEVGRRGGGDTPGQLVLPGEPEPGECSGVLLFEPADSARTLQAAEGLADEFAIWGPNINLDGNKQITAVIDAHTILTLYRAQCAAMGLDCSALIVVGGHAS